MQHHRTLGHQCHACRRHWALRIVDHPAGRIVLCRFCSTVRATSGAARLGAAGPAGGAGPVSRAALS